MKIISTTTAVIKCESKYFPISEGNYCLSEVIPVQHSQT